MVAGTTISRLVDFAVARRLSAHSGRDQAPPSPSLWWQVSMEELGSTNRIPRSEYTMRLNSIIFIPGRVLDITTLYLDTTFCTPVATEIPSRVWRLIHNSFMLILHNLF